MEKTAVEMKDFTFSYENSGKILDKASFSLNYGEFVLLSGLSGEGKSTLLSALSGIIPNTISGEYEGKIFVDSEDITGQSITKTARKVGYVLQNPDSQIFHSKVADEIAFGCENLNFSPQEIKERIDYSCSLFDLDPNAGTRTLSGGQKQRLMVACVLAMGQKILLLDEPLANLDLGGSHLLLRTLKNLCSEGYAVLLVEHRLDVVMPYAHRVLSLEEGKVKEKENATYSYEVMDKISFDAPEHHFNERLLTVKNLAYSVNGFNILKDVSFTLDKGERIVILGENGSGKTTLIRLLAGLIKPTGGKVENSFSVKIGSRAWFRRVGYVYQEPSYQLFMPSVKEEVMFAAKSDWGEKSLEAFELTALSSQHPHSLSEGQKRRLSIAAIAATAPDILLLDEPTVGQDFRHLEMLVNSLNKLHTKTENAIITITHDYRCAEALADRVIWIKDGLVYRDGGRELVSEYFENAAKGE